MTHKIGWLNRPGTTGETWNPVTGCTKISAGCKNCYAERMSKRLKGRFGYPEDEPFAVTLHEDKLDAPLKWKNPRTVFVCSMGDLFHKDVELYTLVNVWRTMAATPQHTYMVLTKRAHRMKSSLRPLVQTFGVLPNVWGLVTAENQMRADERIPLLLQSPFAVRGVSIEPMLGAVELLPYLYRRCNHCNGTLGDEPGDRRCSRPYWGNTNDRPGLDWIICGGETGPGARTMQLSWAYNVMRQCKGAGVPFFFKSAGKNIAIPDDLMVREWPGGAE